MVAVEIPERRALRCGRRRRRGHLRRRRGVGRLASRRRPAASASRCDWVRPPRRSRPGRRRRARRGPAAAAADGADEERTRHRPRAGRRPLPRTTPLRSAGWSTSTRRQHEPGEPRRGGRPARTAATGAACRAGVGATSTPTYRKKSTADLSGNPASPFRGGTVPRTADRTPAAGRAWTPCPSTSPARSRAGAGCASAASPAGSTGGRPPSSPAVVAAGWPRRCEYRDALTRRQRLGVTGARLVPHRRSTLVPHRLPARAGQPAVAEARTRWSRRGHGGRPAGHGGAAAGLGAADLDHHLPRRSGPRPDPDGPPPRAAGRRPHHDRARQGAAGTGRWPPCGPCSGSGTTATCDVWLLDEGDDPEVRRRCARARRPALQPQGPAGVEPARRGRSARGPSTATTTAGGSGTSSTTTSSRRWTPTTSRSRTSSSARSATSPTPTSPSSSRRRCTATCGSPSWPAGRAQLAYLFHGIIQRGGNGHDAPLLIGTNHLYRPAAFAPDRRLPGLHHRGPPDLDGDLHRGQRDHRPELEGRLHPRHPGRRRGAGHLLRLLQPAEALGLRHLGDRPAALAGAVPEHAHPAAALVVLRPAEPLPDDGARLGRRHQP